MKYKTQGHCPYCDTELGIITGWSMSVQGFQEYLKKHEANHPENTPNGIPTDTSYIGGVNFDPDIRPEEKLPEDIWFDEQVNLALDKQKAEIISLIMGMETKDKGRESDEFDQGMEIMRAKIINKIRAIK